MSGDGDFIYDAAPGFIGSDSFTYRISDGIALSNVATVTIDVQVPTAVWLSNVDRSTPPDLLGVLLLLVPPTVWLGRRSLLRAASLGRPCARRR